MYGLIVPPGVPPDVAEALEGTHGNCAVDELQTRMALRELAESPARAGLRNVEYVSTGERTRWMALGEAYGRQ